MNRNRQVTVYLNVYDLSPHNWHSLGLGAYHTGVEIYGKEWTYGNHDNASTGVFSIQPRSAASGVFREQMVIGSIIKTDNEVEGIVSGLKSKFLGNEYNLLTRNCNHFSGSLLEVLGLRMPSFVNRLAACGACCSCFLPAELVRPDATRAPGSGGGSDFQTGLIDSKSEPSFKPFTGTGQSLVDEKSKKKLKNEMQSATKMGKSQDDQRDRVRNAALSRLTKIGRSDHEGYNKISDSDPDTVPTTSL
jgi:hypothetical protein